MQFKKCRFTRPPKERILILCEGEKTEPNYFNGIKAAHKHSLTATRIVVHNTKKNTAKELVAEAISMRRAGIREMNPYDEIWVVVDRDGYSKHPESIDRARSTNIKIAFSSPCFEYWYLLHFQFTTKLISDGKEMCKELCKHIPNYDKSADYFKDFFHDKTYDAIENGEKVLSHWDEVGDGKLWNHVPYTNVGQLVDRLLSIF
jgi:hypothetical protein